MNKDEPNALEHKVRDAYKILGISDDKQRQKIWDELSVFQEKIQTHVRIKGDNITTLYPQN
jgi:enolase